MTIDPPAPILAARRALARALAATIARASPCCRDRPRRRPIPAKPITFIVPFAAGSATDQLARALGQSITAADQAGGHRRQPRRRERHDRGAGTWRALPADGYTVLITTNTTHAANEHLYKKLPTTR